MRLLWRALRHWVFPDLCLACGERLRAEEVRICRLCLATWPRADLERVGLPGPWRARALDWVTAVWVYDGQDRVQRVVYALKYRGFSRLAWELGPILAEQIRERAQEVGLRALVPVPLHRRRLRERGYNQSERLAEAVGAVLGLPVWNALERLRPTRSQTGLGPSERLQNVQGAFRVRNGEDLRGLRLLLVDDVLTTGATLAACAQALRMAGADWVGGLALATVPSNVARSLSPEAHRTK
ncbi:MAG: phosphoribosyltransferase family protein [Bacteroidota bacterium]|nr:phosphoribosyltransferase family protein [Rhodothermia bacterium]MDW8284640.1 phosphoribosyltransferase family protein [Bacteroidota bacterium]